MDFIKAGTINQVLHRTYWTFGNITFYCINQCSVCYVLYYVVCCMYTELSNQSLHLQFPVNKYTTTTTVADGL